MAKTKTSFKPGQIANPHGRPKKGLALTELLRGDLELDDKSGKSNKEIIIEKLIEGAKKGDLAFLKYVYERMEGQPKQSVQLSGDNENPIVINIKPV